MTVFSHGEHITASKLNSILKEQEINAECASQDSSGSSFYETYFLKKDVVIFLRLEAGESSSSGAAYKHARIRINRRENNKYVQLLNYELQNGIENFDFRIDIDGEYKIEGEAQGSYEFGTNENGNQWESRGYAFVGIRFMPIPASAEIGKPIIHLDNPRISLNIIHGTPLTVNVLNSGRITTLNK